VTQQYLNAKQRYNEVNSQIQRIEETHELLGEAYVPPPLELHLLTHLYPEMYLDLHLHLYPESDEPQVQEAREKAGTAAEADLEAHSGLFLDVPRSEEVHRHDPLLPYGTSSAFCSLSLCTTAFTS
jgi:hypothetical protein